MTDREKLIFNILKDVALEDGVMRLEETKIISHAMRTAIKFEYYLEEALKDGTISEEEREQLNSFRERIYKEAEEIASQDNIISPDEARLLQKLGQKLNELDEFNPQ